MVGSRQRAVEDGSRKTEDRRQKTRETRDVRWRRDGLQCVNRPMPTKWKPIADFAKHRPAVLRLADKLGRGRGRLRWLDHLSHIPPAPCKPDLAGWADHELAATCLGHATVLIRIGGLTILTDPVFSLRIGMGLGLLTAGPLRHLAPALSMEELPPIDLILLSHAHFDHLDRPTLNRLPKTIPIITAPRTRDLIADLGFQRITELRWDESADLSQPPIKGVASLYFDKTKACAPFISITARRVNHWGARTFQDEHRGFNAYLIESPRHRVLFGGDSGYHEHYKDLKDIDLAIFGIAAYDPYRASHTTPEEALAMADHCRARHILPMHHSTFKLSHEPLTEPIERLLAAGANHPAQIVAPSIGAMWSEG